MCHDDFDHYKDIFQCNYCQDIIKITDIKGIKSLWCHDCPELVEISDIKGLESLYCYNCPKLLKIADIQGLKILDCAYCESLIKIPAIQTLEEIDCTGCQSLIEISFIKNLKDLFFPDCEKLNLINVKLPDTIRHIGSDKLKWKNNSSNRKKLITLQRWFKNMLMSRKIIKIIPLLMPLYYHPDSKGGYFHKKEMLTSLMNLESLACPC